MNTKQYNIYLHENLYVRILLKVSIRLILHPTKLYAAMRRQRGGGLWMHHKISSHHATLTITEESIFSVSFIEHLPIYGGFFVISLFCWI